MKPNGKWRVCTDYRILNKAYPKDSYPMPNIDQLVNNSAGFQLLSFIDAYFGYNQITVVPKDQHKMAFSKIRDSTDALWPYQCPFHVGMVNEHLIP